MRLASSSLLPLASLGAAALLLLLLSPAAEAKVGKTKLSPDGLETSQIGLGALHFAELDGKDAHVCGAVDAWVLCCVSDGIIPGRPSVSIVWWRRRLLLLPPWRRLT